MVEGCTKVEVSSGGTKICVGQDTLDCSETSNDGNDDNTDTDTETNTETDSGNETTTN